MDKQLLLIYHQASKILDKENNITQLQCTKILALRYFSSFQIHINNEKSARGEDCRRCYKFHVSHFFQFTTLQFCRILPVHSFLVLKGEWVGIGTVWSFITTHQSQQSEQLLLSLGNDTKIDLKHPKMLILRTLLTMLNLTKPHLLRGSDC